MEVPDNGAVSSAPIDPAKAPKPSRRNKFDWSPVELVVGALFSVVYIRLLKLEED